MTEELDFVSVVVPMRNEDRFIERCIRSILEQDYPADRFEIIVVDGGSSDGSVDIVKSLAGDNPKIKLLGRAGVNCPAAMNIGISEAKGSLISKVDAHGYIAADFLRINITYMKLYAAEGVKCIGGPIRYVAGSTIAKANVYARSSVFGVGMGVYSGKAEAKFADTVQCGTYKKAVFNEIGGFDELLQFGEDEEINWRIIKRGYKIFSTPEVKFFYYPRDSCWKFYKQYFNYGVGRVKVIRKHPDFIRIKHLIPSLLILVLSASGILSIFSKLSAGIFCAVAGSYLIISLISTALVCKNKGWRYFAVLPVSFAALHFGYGLGFLSGFFRERSLEPCLLEQPRSCSYLKGK